MQVSTGKIFENLTENDAQEFEKKFEEKLVPLTDKQVEKLKPLSKRRRKMLFSGMSCPCASGKSFKKCNCKAYHSKK
jgi:hypothetical protein